MKYADYIRSPQWASVRERKIRLSRNSCDHCGNGAPFHIHHVTYRNLGRERDYELMTLCVRCHVAIEAIIQTGKHTRRGNLKGLIRYTHNRLIEAGIPRRSDAKPTKPHRPKKRFDLRPVVQAFTKLRNQQLERI